MTSLSRTDIQIAKMMMNSVESSRQGYVLALEEKISLTKIDDSLT